MQISTRIGVVQVIGVLLIPMHRIHWVKFGAQAHWEARGHHVRHARFTTVAFSHVVGASEQHDSRSKATLREPDDTRSREDQSLHPQPARRLITLRPVERLG
jgi:hypothetical protein